LRQTIAEQEQMLQVTLRGEARPSGESELEEQVAAERRKLAEDRKAVNTERVQLEIERLGVEHARLQLDRDRRIFQQDVQAALPTELPG
jgi:hypothetical protein